MGKCESGCVFMVTSMNTKVGPRGACADSDWPRAKSRRAARFVVDNAHKAIARITQIRLALGFCYRGAWPKH